MNQLDSLTPREREVAELVADGLSNREVAQALVITVCTVQTHLAHIYAKLDICSRSELVIAITNEDSPSLHARIRELEDYIAWINQMTLAEIMQLMEKGKWPDE